MTEAVRPTSFFHLMVIRSQVSSEPLAVLGARESCTSSSVGTPAFLIRLLPMRCAMLTGLAGNAEPRLAAQEKDDCAKENAKDATAWPIWE